MRDGDKHGALIEALRNGAKAIYIAADKEVAEPVSKLMTQAAEALSAPSAVGESNLARLLREDRASEDYRKEADALAAIEKARTGFDESAEIQQKAWDSLSPRSHERRRCDYCAPQWNCFRGEAECIKAAIPGERALCGKLAASSIGAWEPHPNVAPDDGDFPTVLASLRTCAASWQGDVRVMGNVRAKDIVRAINETEAALSATMPLVETLVEAAIMVDDEAEGTFLFNRKNIDALERHIRRVLEVAGVPTDGGGA